jgi:hypothetical protein
VRTFTALARRTNEKALSVSPNSSARPASMRPAATGRFSVRLPISRSISASRTWFSALAPPQASARPAIVATKSDGEGRPRAPTTMPHAPVSRSSVMIRGLVSVT